jgi:hypothetical protein
MNDSLDFTKVYFRGNVNDDYGFSKLLFQIKIGDKIDSTFILKYITKCFYSGILLCF